MQPFDKYALIRGGNGTDAPAPCTYLLCCRMVQFGALVESRHDVTTAEIQDRVVSGHRQFYAGVLLDLYERVLGLLLAGFDIEYVEELDLVQAEGELNGKSTMFLMSIEAERSFSLN